MTEGQTFFCAFLPKRVTLFSPSKIACAVNLLFMRILVQYGHFITVLFRLIIGIRNPQKKDRAIIRKKSFLGLHFH